MLHVEAAFTDSMIKNVFKTIPVMRDLVSFLRSYDSAFEDILNEVCVSNIYIQIICRWLFLSICSW